MSKIVGRDERWQVAELKEDLAVPQSPLRKTREARQATSSVELKLNWSIQLNTELRSSMFYKEIDSRLNPRSSGSHKGHGIWGRIRTAELYHRYEQQG